MLSWVWRDRLPALVPGHRSEHCADPSSRYVHRSDVSLAVGLGRGLVVRPPTRLTAGTNGGVTCLAMATLS